MASSVVSNEMHVILGASGNTGSIIANSLLSEGKKVRVVGRDAGRLQRFVDKGAEAFTANLSDAAALTKAFSHARAAYLLLPPAKSREDQTSVGPTPPIGKPEETEMQRKRRDRKSVV